MRFFEFVSDQVSTDLKTDLQGIVMAIPKAEKYLLNALSIFDINENASRVSTMVDDHILSNNKFLKFLSTRWQTHPISGGLWGYQRSCGKDGCAYFMEGKKVVKFTEDFNEVRIANSIKGKLKIAPVIDVIGINISSVDVEMGAILMKELNTDIYRMTEAVKSASGILSDICHTLMNLIERKPNTPFEYILKRLSPNYMLRFEGGHVDEETRDALIDLIKMVRLIYKKSGYLLGADWTTRNVGVTGGGQAMAFDLGRPQHHAITGMDPKDPDMIEI